MLFRSRLALLAPLARPGTKQKRVRLPAARDGRRCLVCLMSRALPRRRCLDSAHTGDICQASPHSVNPHVRWARGRSGSLSDIAVRDEAKEVRPDARPQAWKNRRRIRRNTLRIFSGRERCRWSRIVRRSKTVNAGQAPRHRNTGHTRTDAAATAWHRLPCCVCSGSRPRSGLC